MRMQVFHGVICIPIALLSLKLQLSATNTSSHHVWRDGRMEEMRSSPRWFSPPLRLQNVSNYLHLPPTNLCKPSRAFISQYPPWCKNYPNSTPSHLSCKPPRLDDIHSPLPPPGFVTPQLIRTEMRVEKTGKERSEDERLSCRKGWWNLRCFSCNDVSHLCVQKVIYSEWSSRRRDLRGAQFHQVGEMAWGGRQWPFWCTLFWRLWRAIWKSMHLFKHGDRWNHTHSQHNHSVETHAKLWERTLFGGTYAHVLT